MVVANHKVQHNSSYEGMDISAVIIFVGEGQQPIDSIVQFIGIGRLVNDSPVPGGDMNLVGSHSKPAHMAVSQCIVGQYAVQLKQHLHRKVFFIVMPQKLHGVVVIHDHPFTFVPR